MTVKLNFNPASPATQEIFIPDGVENNHDASSSEQQIHTIYLLRNEVNGKVYIGVTNNYPKRMREHSYASNNYMISKAIRKHGWEKFTSHILTETVNREEEKQYITQYRSNDPSCGYNLTEGGEGSLGYSPNETARNRMREKKLGRKLTIEHRENISLSSKGHTVSEKTREKIRNALKNNKHGLGKKLSDDNKHKLSVLKSKKYIVISPEGKSIQVTNMLQFCILNNLSSSAMYRVASGKDSQHKGWSAP